MVNYERKWDITGTSFFLWLTETKPALFFHFQRFYLVQIGIKRMIEYLGVGLPVNFKQVRQANKDASPFICCFIVVVWSLWSSWWLWSLFGCIRIIINHFCLFSLSYYRPYVRFWPIQRMRFRRTDQRRD